MTNWIEWNGGECPVSGDRLVEVLWDDGTTTGPLRADSWVWDGSAYADIVAYRLVDAPCATTGAESVAKANVIPPTVSASALTTQPSGTHYSDAAIQPVQFIEANKLGFLEGCIVKRATRHNHPTGKGSEDIRKIIHEAQLLLEIRYGEAA